MRLFSPSVAAGSFSARATEKASIVDVLLIGLLYARLLRATTTTAGHRLGPYINNLRVLTLKLAIFHLFLSMRENFCYETP